jgi:amidophosphoribosyltransferase
VGIDVNGGRLFRDIEPGELVIIDETHGIRSKKVLNSSKKAFCMFEYVYFARVDSILENKSVYQIRYELGKNLAKIDSVEADIVVPVPDSARPAAAGYSQISGLPVVEGLIKNRYVGRTFIMPFQKARDSAMRVKINPIIPEIRDKRIVLIDDSIVRGTTSKRIVDLLKHAGAKEVHFRVTCPPLIGQCFYGIDISSRTDLIASEKITDTIRCEIHADTLVYQPIDGLVQALRTSKEDLCLGCLTLEYPTPTAQSLSDLGQNWDGKDK